MKRIEFIAPVEAMRGNLSGKQGLEYPLNNGAAYDAPVGSKSYARNYQPRFIGAKRASDNLKYFAVKTKSAIHMTLKQKKAMAVLGGTGAIVGAILKDKAGENYRTLLGFYEEMKPYLNGMSFRKYLSTQISGALRVKSRYFYFTNPAHQGGSQSFAIGNPWVLTTPSTHWVELSTEILAKFWSELATNPITFTLKDDGVIMKGVAHEGEKFATVISGNYNVLGLTAVGNDVRYDGRDVMIGEEEEPASAMITDTIDASEVYVVLES